VFEVDDPQLRDRVSDSRKFQIRRSLAESIPEAECCEHAVAGDLIDPPVIAVQARLVGLTRARWFMNFER
jgi:hypothetical protein